MNQLEVKEKIENRTHYPVSMEIEGALADFARPDSGSESTSYPAPTWSAVKGIFESILFMPSVNVIPVKVQICKPIQYYTYAFNYRGDLRKTDLIKNENARQVKSNVLIDVCYRIFAVVINNDNFLSTQKYSKYKKNNPSHFNHAHSYQAQFNRRILKGQNNEPPFLGISEFLSSYAGDFRSTTQVEDNINFTIPSMLFNCFDALNQGKWNPSFVQNVQVENGELNYVK